MTESRAANRRRSNSALGAGALALLALLHASDALAGPDAPKPCDLRFASEDVAKSRGITSIAMSPDGAHLYAVTILGEIKRWRIDEETGDLFDEQSIAPPDFQQPEGPRGLIGMAFDPADPLTLWVTDNHPIPLNGVDEDVPDFSGRVLIVSIAPGAAFEATVRPYLTGLPRSCSDHVTNSIAFHRNDAVDQGGPDHFLYLSQGANTAMGGSDRRWCQRPERLLSAAILQIDPRREAPAGGFDLRTEPLPPDGKSRRFGYDWVLRGRLWAGDDGVLTNGGIEIDSGPHEGGYLHFDERGVASVRAGVARDSEVLATFYDPYAPDAVAKLYVTGVRNAYDLLWHSNGLLYLPINGSAGGGTAPDIPSTDFDESGERLARQPDFLFTAVEGAFAGHPNALRGEFVAYGGNPTAGVDPFEIPQYPVGVAPDPRFDPNAVHDLGYHPSANGVIEYPLDGAGAARSMLLIVNYSQGNNVTALPIGEDGGVLDHTTLHGPDDREIVNGDPLDLANGRDGRVYLSTLLRNNGVSKIVKLTPEMAAHSAERRASQ